MMQKVRGEQRMEILGKEEATERVVKYNDFRTTPNPLSGMQVQMQSLHRHYTAAMSCHTN